MLSALLQPVTEIGEKIPNYYKFFEVCLVRDTGRIRKLIFVKVEDRAISNEYVWRQI